MTTYTEVKGLHQALTKLSSSRFSVVASTTSTEQYEDPHNEAERLTIFAALEGNDRLLNRHRKAWEELWESDIIIEGDDQAQRDVRFAVYHLYSFAREGTAYSLSPMGLSGFGNMKALSLRNDDPKRASRPFDVDRDGCAS